MHVCIYVCRHTQYIYTYMYVSVCIYIHITHMHVYESMCHTGMFSGTMKSLVHALGTDSSMAESTINSTLYTFIEQVNFYDLQKMVLQFAICFVPTLGYTCGDPVSSQSLVSRVETQSRLVKWNNVLLPSGSTTADLHFQATHSHWSG